MSTTSKSPKRARRTPTKYDTDDTDAVPGQCRSEVESNQKSLSQGGKVTAKSSQKGGKVKSSPQLKTGGHSMKKAMTHLQKTRKKTGLDTNADSVCESSITFYPEWNGKLADLNEWSTLQGGTTFKKSNDNTLTAKIDKNLTVNFFTASRSFTITKGQATRKHMVNKKEIMQAWLESTHDSDHNLDDDLEEILSHEATWKAPSQAISRSPSTTHIEEVEADGSQPARKEVKDTPKANEPEEYDSILDTNYMRDIDKHLTKEDDVPVYSVRKEHVPIMWNTIVKTVLKHNTFKHFDNWLAEYMKGLSNQKAAAIKWFMDNVPKMLTLILNKNCAQLAKDTETERVKTLLGTNTDMGMPSLDSDTDMTKPQPKDQPIKRSLSRSLTGPAMAHMDGEKGNEGQMTDILTRLSKLEEENGTLKAQLDITSAQTANLHNNKFNPTNIPDVTFVEKRLVALEKAMIPFTDEDKAQEAIDAKRQIPKIVFNAN
jgi:hypothetical protein